MIFVSQLILGRRDLKELKVTDDYSVHRVIYNFFVDQRDSEQKKMSESSGFLYVDLGGNALGRRFLMLSNRIPKEMELNDSRIETKVLKDEFLLANAYRFKVVVNPTRRDAQTRKLVAVKGRENIAEWFAQRAINTWGFCTDESLAVDKVEVKQFKGKDDHKIVITQAHISGILTVTDRDRFIKAVSQGIGRSHAFGCGLLQIVPINQI